MEYSDEEEIQRLKKWWRQYGRYLLVAVIIGLLLGYAWRYHKNNKQQRLADASVLYQQIIADPISKTNLPTAPILLAAKNLLQRYPNTAYADLTSLWLAKTSVLKSDWDGAIGYLQRVVKQGKNASVRQIARLRASRVYLQQKHYMQSLSVLDTVDDDSYRPLVDVQKGDIYVAQNNWQHAQRYYLSAQQQFSAHSIADLLLARKLSQVMVHLKSNAPETNTPVKVSSQLKATSPVKVSSQIKVSSQD